MQPNFNTAVNYNVNRSDNILLQHPGNESSVLVEHSHPSPDELMKKLPQLTVNQLMNELFHLQACKEFHKTRNIEWLLEKDHDVTRYALSAAIGEDKQMINTLNFRLMKLMNKKRPKPQLSVIPSSNGNDSYSYFDSGST